MEQGVNLHRKWPVVVLCSRPGRMCPVPPSPTPIQRNIVYIQKCIIAVKGKWGCSEIHSADWWWETQDRYPTGATTVLLICDLDKMQLTDISGQRNSGRSTWLFGEPIVVYGTTGAISCTLSLPSSRCHSRFKGITLPMTEPRGMYTGRCSDISPTECWSRSWEFPSRGTSIPGICEPVWMAKFTSAGKFSCLGLWITWSMPIVWASNTMLTRTVTHQRIIWGYWFFHQALNRTCRSQPTSSRDVGSTRMQSLLATIRRCRSLRTASNQSFHGWSHEWFRILHLLMATTSRCVINYISNE